ICRLFDDVLDSAVAVELDDAEVAQVRWVRLLAQHDPGPALLRAKCVDARPDRALEDVVGQEDDAAVTVDELLGQAEGFGDAAREYDALHRHRILGLMVESATTPCGRLAAAQQMPRPDNWPRTILHVDLDAFYTSVHQRDDPKLRGSPVAVAGRSRRAVVMGASYEARAYGVRSAMPLHEALQLCPQLAVVAPDGARYRQASRLVHQIFRRFTS